MRIKKLNRSESRQAMQEWINTRQQPNLSSDYQEIRDDIYKIYMTVYTDLSKKNKYKEDAEFALALYDYFNSKVWFNLRLASDSEFWAYLSLCVVPQIVGERWGDDNEDHFWKRATRSWLLSSWWYVFFSWQGNREDTERLLLDDKRFSTDTITSLVERAGYKGANENVYREIMHYYGKISQSEIDKFMNKHRKTSQRIRSLFRIIMKLNTATCLTIDAALVEGGEKAYVKSLFQELGINTNEIGN